MARILILDDDLNILESLKRLLARKKHLQVEYFSEPSKALERAESGLFELFISDFNMPLMDGVTFLSKTKEIHPRSQRIILSGCADLNTVVDAINNVQIYRFINKPWHNLEFIAAIEQALEYHRVLTENHFLSELAREHNLLPEQ
ncbi:MULTISPECIES: response regulator [unclassified Pseudoalteromonas]|uniref:response regulator n=1 Tax=unclassified Pseudoalteromonas TaxID=194690 RepID=UPI0006944619|nr:MULTISPECIES: response regulator [unclassified Pseudoalteromonas]